jgi:hypothetical protein
MPLLYIVFMRQLLDKDMQQFSIKDRWYQRLLPLVEEEEALLSPFSRPSLPLLNDTTVH